MSSRPLVSTTRQSPLRGREFVTRKITLSLAQIRHGELDVLELGNLDAKRDWGFAGDYVKGMWQMLQQDEAEDFVLASGESRTVRSFVDAAASHLGFDIEWSGAAENERGTDRRSGKLVVRVNPAFYRPAEVDALLGNPQKARNLLGWQPAVGFEELVRLMTDSDDRPSAEQLDLFTYSTELEEEQARVEQVNSDRAGGRGYLVFAIDPAVGPDEPGYRRVFTTEAKTPGQAMAKVRPLVPRCRLRVYLATGVYRDELAEAGR